VNAVAPFKASYKTLLAALVLCSLASCSIIKNTVPTLGDKWRGSGAPIPAGSVPNSVAVQWQSEVGRAKGNGFMPAFGEKQIYVTGATGGIAALAEENGRPVSKVEVPKAISGGVGVGENLIAVGTDKGEIFAFDLAGRQLWKSDVAGEILAPPVVTSNAVLVRAADGRILSLNRGDGKRIWVYQRATPALTLRTNAGVIVSRSTVYAGYAGGRVVAIELDSGKPVWEATISVPRGATELERISDVAALPVLDDNRICVGVFQGRTGCLETLNGNVLWARDLSSAAGVVVDTKNLYVVDVQGNIHALDKLTGASVWKQEKLVKRVPRIPVLLGGKLLVADDFGAVHALSAVNGDLLSSVTTDGTAITALNVQASRAIVQTEKGGVFALSVSK
jgi:outer membrane protein assembly factor BamB